MVGPEKKQALEKRMKRLCLEESDIEEKFVKGSGSGGQKINKTSSAVYLHHIPSGIEIKCQKTRSQADNRYFARLLLCQKVEAEILGQKSEEQKRIEKLRRQKRKRSKRAKEKMLSDKKHRSETKKNRSKPKV